MPFDDILPEGPVALPTGPFPSPGPGCAD